MLTVTEVCEALQIAPDRVYYEIKSGKIDAKKRKSGWLIPQKEFERLRAKLKIERSCVPLKSWLLKKRKDMNWFYREYYRGHIPNALKVDGRWFIA